MISVKYKYTFRKKYVIVALTNLIVTTVKGWKAKM
jgi:hypothetical protein